MSPVSFSSFAASLTNSGGGSGDDGKRTYVDERISGRESFALLRST
jgi:hypothetical protein